MSYDQLRYLSEKKVHLNNPGNVVSNIYYNVNNNLMDDAEVTYNFGRYSQSLSNTSFGAQSTIVIPNQSLLRNCYLYLEAPSVEDNQTLPRGWGFAAIDSISYLWGSANTSQLSISGQTNFQTSMLECATEEKKSEMLRLAGEEYLSSTSDTIDAIVPLSLPWSNQGCCKLPFDTNLISSPITISIKLKSADRLYGGSGSKPQALEGARLLLSQGNMLHESLGLADSLVRNEEFRYHYPFIHKQSGVTSVSSSAGVQTSVNLLSFINADLVAISFGLVKRSYINDPSGSQPPNPFVYDDISDIELDFNGTLMYVAPGRSYKLINAQDQAGANFVKNSLIQVSGSTFTSVGVDTYPVLINFSQNPALTYNRRYYNVWRIGNNTLNLRFTPKEEGPYYLYTTYYFNGMASVNGDTEIYFD